MLLVILLIIMLQLLLLIMVLIMMLFMMLLLLLLLLCRPFSAFRLVLTSAVYNSDLALCSSSQPQSSANVQIHHSG